MITYSSQWSDFQVLNWLLKRPQQYLPLCKDEKEDHALHSSRDSIYPADLFTFVSAFLRKEDFQINLVTFYVLVEKSLLFRCLYWLISIVERTWMMTNRMSRGSLLNRDPLRADILIIVEIRIRVDSGNWQCLSFVQCNLNSFRIRSPSASLM